MAIKKTTAPKVEEKIVAAAPEEVMEISEEELTSFEVPAPVTEPPVVLPGIFSRISPVLLYLPFFAKLQQLAANCEKRGVRYYCTSGVRTWEEQTVLHNQGRKTPGKIVTNAKAGQSFHNYNVAADFCRDADLKRDGLQPLWGLEDYRVLAEEAKKIKLESAFNWESFKEGPHVQLPLERVGIELSQLRSLYLAGGIKAVFQLLDKYQW